MKMLVGVDGEGPCRPALSLLARLKFSNPELTLEFPDDLGPYKMSPDEAVQKGAPGLRELDTMAALVARAQREACSLLICRGEVAPLGSVHCLFATDHSAYSAHVFDFLLGLNPGGIREMTIFTAIEPTDRMEVANLHRHLADRFGGVHDTREIAQRNSQMADRLIDRGIRAQSRLRTGLVAHQVDVAMKETGAELLILGAHGQEQPDSSYLGNVAAAVLHGATYPVLILIPSP